MMNVMHDWHLDQNGYNCPHTVNFFQLAVNAFYSIISVSIYLDILIEFCLTILRIKI